MISLPGGPIIMTSLNVKEPSTALTDLDFKTCTSDAIELITATLVLSVFKILLFSSWRIRDMF